MQKLDPRNTLTLMLCTSWYRPQQLSYRICWRHN